MADWGIFAMGCILFLGSWRNVREAQKLLAQAQAMSDRAGVENAKTRELLGLARQILDGDQ